MRSGLGEWVLAVGTARDRAWRREKAPCGPQWPLACPKQGGVLTSIVR